MKDRKKKSSSSRRLLRGMVSLYEKGWTYEKIGTWYGVTKESVRQSLSGLITPRKPGNRRPIPKEIEEQIIADGKSLKSIGEISRGLKVSPFVVKRILAVAGIKPERTRKITLSDVEKMTDLYKKGQSYQAIAKQFNVSATAVFRRLRGAVDSRPRGPRPGQESGPVDPAMIVNTHYIKPEFMGHDEKSGLATFSSGNAIYAISIPTNKDNGLKMEIKLECNGMTAFQKIDFGVVAERKRFSVLAAESVGMSPTIIQKHLVTITKSLRDLC